jgi:hypothetical protein
MFVQSCSCVRGLISARCEGPDQPTVVRNRIWPFLLRHGHILASGPMQQQGRPTIHRHRFRSRQLSNRWRHHRARSARSVGAWRHAAHLVEEVLHQDHVIAHGKIGALEHRETLAIVMQIEGPIRAARKLRNQPRRPLARLTGRERVARYTVRDHHDSAVKSAVKELQTIRRPGWLKTPSIDTFWRSCSPGKERT